MKSYGCHLSSCSSCHTVGFAKTVLVVENQEEPQPDLIELCASCFAKVATCATCQHYDHDAIQCLYAPVAVKKFPYNRCAQSYAQLRPYTREELVKILQEFDDPT